MRRLVGIFGGSDTGPLGGGFGADDGWETNTLISDLVTVICLDDYHLNDRAGRKVSGLTALNLKEQNFELMREQVATLKAGGSVAKQIYNHVNGTMDTPELINPTPIIILEGLHPMADKEVTDMLDFSIYLDITPEVKLGWKIERDMKERGWALEQIKESIAARQPDFDAFVEPQREDADLTIQVLPSDLVNEFDGSLKVRFVQKKGSDLFTPVHLFSENIGTGKVTWTPCADQVECEHPGLKFSHGEEDWFGNPADVFEMDGKIKNLEQAATVEKMLVGTGGADGELTKELVKAAGSPGSNDGTGFYQTLAAFKIREIYNKLSGK